MRNEHTREQVTRWRSSGGLRRGLRKAVWSLELLFKLTRVLLGVAFKVLQLFLMMMPDEKKEDRGIGYYNYMTGKRDQYKKAGGLYDDL